MPRLLPCLFLLLASPVLPATVVRLDLPELAQRAGRIVLARCLSASTERAESGIETRYRFAVDQIVKGDTSATVELLLPGGLLDGVRTRVPGMPDFAPGDEVVLFLSRAGGTGAVWPIGLGQGKYSVQRAGAAKSARVYQDSTGQHFADSALTSGQGMGDGMLLKEFLARVRTLVTEQAEGDRLAR
jgi:hypothetical protein